MPDPPMTCDCSKQEGPQGTEHQVRESAAIAHPTVPVESLSEGPQEREYQVPEYVDAAHLLPAAGGS